LDKKTTTVLQIVTVAVAVLLCVAILWQPIAEQASPKMTFGNTTVGDESYQFSTNKEAVQVQLPSPGIIQSISVYFSNSQNDLFESKTAIYSDASGFPGELIVQSSSEKACSFDGWQTFKVDSAQLVPGCYWLAVIVNSPLVKGRILTKGALNLHCVEDSQYSHEFSNTFGAPKFSSGSLSIYATCTPAFPFSKESTHIAQSVVSSSFLALPTPSLSPLPTLPNGPYYGSIPEPLLNSSGSEIPVVSASPGATHAVVSGSSPLPEPVPESSPGVMTLAKVSTVPASANKYPQESLGLYSDHACTQEISAIVWGNLSPGTSKSIAVYVRNQAATPISLSEASSGFSPAWLASCLTMGWDYDGSKLSSNSLLKLTLTLSVAANCPQISRFSFNTIITAAS